jgi:predicted Rossmann-fold nucleotide-binding protein
MMWQSVAVFCGSKTGNNNLFVQHARETGLLIASRGNYIDLLVAEKMA